MPRYQDIARQLKTAIEQGELKLAQGYPRAVPGRRSWVSLDPLSKMLMLSWWRRDGWSGGDRRVPLSVSRYIRNSLLWMSWLLLVKVSSRCLFRWGYLHLIFFRVNCGRG